MSKLTELLAELDKEIIDYGAVTLTKREYDLLRSALREREGMVLLCAVCRFPVPEGGDRYCDSGQACPHKLAAAEDAK